MNTLALCGNQRALTPRHLPFGFVIALSFLCFSCSLVFDPELKNFCEYGDRCVENVECASGICHHGRCSDSCTTTCQGEADCENEVCLFRGPAALDGNPRIGFLLYSEVGEHGMTKTHDDGRQHILNTIPEAEARVDEAVTRSDAPAIIDMVADDDFNVVVGAHSDYLQPITNGALRHPEVNFLMFGAYTGFDAGPNLGSYMGRMYQVMYMLGNMAARVTETGRVGVVGPFANPFSVRNINAFAQGVRAFDADIDVVVRWINYWENESLEEQATVELVEMANADVILGFTESAVPLETAASMTTGEGHPVYVIGYGNPDVCELQPSRCISAAYWNWGPMLTGIVQDMMTGNWEPTALWEQIQGTENQSVVYFSSLNVTIGEASDRLAVEGLLGELTRDSVEGRMLPFRGPIQDNENTLQISANTYPTDSDLLTMCWHVRGVSQIVAGDPLGLEPAEVPSSCRNY